MNHNKYILILFLFLLSFGFGQTIDRILPYNNVDTTGVYIIYDGDLKYEKEIQQSPPTLSLIFPHYSLSEGDFHKGLDLAPLYRISAKEKISNRYFKHTRIDLNFSEIPEFRIDHIGENIVRIIWSTKYVKEEPQITDIDVNDIDLEIWSNFNNEVSMNLRDADLVDVLRLLATQSEMNLVASDDINGTVTLTLHNVSVGSALDAMLKVNGYDWFIQDNLIVVKPVDDSVVGGLITKSYKLEHADAFSIGTALSNVLTEKGKFQVFSPVAGSNFFNNAMSSGGMGNNQSGMGGMQSGNNMGGMAGGMGGQTGGMTGSNPMSGNQTGNNQSGMGGQNMQSMMTADYLLVTDVYSNFDHIENIIKQLDIKVSQVNISVKFIETKLDVNEKLGIDWNFRAEAMGPVSDVDAELVDFGDFKLFDTSSLSLYSITLPAFESVLEMLASDGETRLMQEPQLTTKNNTIATFKVGTTYPTLVTQTTEIAQTTSYTDKEINIILNVQPRINDEEYVSMDISTTVQALVGYTGENSDQPIISNRASTTHVRVEDQKTLMIGGLIFDQAIENRSKVPFISSIPILGKLFTHTTYATEQRELLIFITPSIIEYQ